MPNIVKADGTREPFSTERLKASLRRAGAGSFAAERIAGQIANSVVEGAASKEIYRRAFTLLRHEARPVAARYALRRAMMEFGPSGHPFEDFILHLFRAEGWTVETRKIIQGKCVPHETDLYGTKGDVHLAGELKYHNDPSYKSDLKTALYVKARFDDIFSCDPSRRDCPIDRGILITNTKFTSEAIAYATCAGLELLGWNYPANETLYERLVRAKVYPITALTSLDKSEKNLLIGAGVTAVDELTTRRDALDALHLPPERIGDILSEVEALMTLPHAFV